MKTEDLVVKLLAYKESYYNGTPEISDEDFDAMENELRDIDPDNAYFSIVGTNIKGSNKIKHSIPMRSCAKAKTVEDIFAWQKRIDDYGTLVMMPKIDGLSGSIKYVNGEISYIATRGDGLVGQDVTWLKDYLNIPLTIENKETVEVRGEIYLPKDTKLETNGKPLRNIAAGLVNRKDDKTNCEYLKFIAYGIFPLKNDFFTRELEELWKLDINVVPYTLSSEKDISEFVEEYIATLRSEWNYETDGLVLQIEDKTAYESINSKYTIDHHNYYNIALKPESETATTTLTGITWDVSKNGNMIPVANFKTVYLGNKEIKNATLNNFENVEKLNLHEGDEIVIANANEVIPFFVKKINTGNGRLLIIDECPSCGCLLQRVGVHLKCKNTDCPSQVIKKITDYCVRCEMDGVAESTVLNLYYALDMHSICDLYSLKDKRSELLAIEGFGESKVDNLLAQIEKSKKQTDLQLISNLGIEGVHEKALIKLRVDSLEKLYTFYDTSSVNGQKVVEFVANNKAFITAMFNVVKPEYKEIKTTDSKGKVCMTGADPWKTGRKELSEKLVSMGYEPVDSTTKDTNILICEDVNGDSSKLTKARKLGIMIKSYEEFFK